MAEASKSRKRTLLKVYGDGTGTSEQNKLMNVTNDQKCNRKCKENSEIHEKSEGSYKQMGAMEALVNLLKGSIKEKEEELVEKKKSLDLLLKAMSHLDEEIKKKDMQHEMRARALESKVKELEEQREKLYSKQKLMYAEAEEQALQRKKSLDLLQKRMYQEVRELEIKEKKVEQIVQALCSKKKQYKQRVVVLDAKEKQLEEKANCLELIKKKCEGQEIEFDSKQKQLEGQEKEIELKEKEFVSRMKEFEDRVKEIETKENEFNEQVKELRRKEMQFEDRVKEIETKENEFNEQVKELQRKERQFEDLVKELERKEKSFEEQVKELKLKEMQFEGKVKDFDSKYEALTQLFGDEKLPDEELNPSTDGKSLEWLSNVQTNEAEAEFLPSNDVLVYLKTSSDPAQLVLDIIQNPISPWREKGCNGLTIESWQIILLEHLMKLSPKIKPHVRDEAMKLAHDLEADIRASTENSVLVLSYLLLLSIYGLASDFNDDKVLRLLEFAAQHKQALELFQTLGFADKVSDFVQNLIKKHKYIEAVGFICAYNLAEKNQPVDLLREYMRNSKLVCERSCKETKSLDLKIKAINQEIASLDSILRCISDNNIEPQDLQKEIQARIIKLHAEANASVYSVTRACLQKCSNIQ